MKACQDVSHAGKRLGLKPGTRTGLWAHMAYAINKLRPRLVVAENVRGLLSAEAGGDLEPCPWCVGNGERGALRALGAVLADLADMRYDAQWHGVRASDAGAPHGRFRVFVYAWPAEDVRHPGREPGTTQHGQQPDLSAGRVGEPDCGAAADTDRVGHQRPRNTRGRRERPTDHSGAAPADTSGQRHGSLLHPRNLGPVDPDHASETRERERAREVPSHRSPETPTHTDSRGRAGRRETTGRHLGGDDMLNGRRRSLPAEGRDLTPVAWGDYEPAIRRWEHTTGRLAPPPTEPGKSGAPRLSPQFVEWMMGLPHGHVTAVPGLSRNDQLKALGNGCVPQQVALATRMWAATTQGTHPAATAQEGAALLPTPMALDAKGTRQSTTPRTRRPASVSETWQPNDTLTDAVWKLEGHGTHHTPPPHVKPPAQAAARDDTPTDPAATGTDRGLW